MTKTILLIEDTADIRENLAEILELSGYKTLQAPDGKVGVQMALEQDVDLILCDIMMPEMDGYGVLHILQRNPKTNTIPFIFLTAKAEKDDFRKGMNLGADDYLIKPIDDVSLLETIERRLNKHLELTKRITHVPQHFLPEISLLSVLENEIATFETRKFDKKQTIYQEHDVIHAIYYIKSGEVKLTKLHDTGKEFIISVSMENDLLGYWSLLQGNVYHENAVCLTPVEVIVIPKHRFEELIYGNTAISFYLLKSLSKELIEKEQLLIDLVYNSVRKKVSDALLKLSKQGTQPIQWLRDDMASITGIAKETLIRTLSDLKSENLINIQDNTIHILNIKKLEHIIQ